MSDQSTLDGDWLTVSQAAAALGVSERTIRRRCESGKLAATLATTDNGREWQIEAAAVIGAATQLAEVRPSAATTADSAATIGRAPDELRPQDQSILAEMSEGAASGADTSDSELRTGADTLETTLDQSTLVPILREQLAEVREMNSFLRSALEARDRDAAELRAALREALKLSNRALPEPTAQTPQSTFEDARENAPQQPQIAPMSKETPASIPMPQNEPERTEMAPKYFHRSKGLRAWLLKVLGG